MKRLDAYILIGGRSSRLGTDKAFVELGGNTLVERAVDVVRRGLSPDRITAVAGNSVMSGIGAIVADIPFIFDLHEGRGPLGGLHAALSYARSDWIFLIACDYPFISAELIVLLSTRISDKYGSVVPEQKDSRLQPLCAFYNVTKARPIIDEIMERPRVSPPMHDVVDELNPKIVKFEEYSHLDGADKFFLNINTPQDLERARLEFRVRDSSR